MFTNFAKVIIAVVGLVLVVIGWLWYTSGDVIIEPVVIPDRNQGNDTTASTSTDEETGITVPSDWETFTATAEGVALSLRHPASTTVETVDETIIEIKYVGPNSEPHTEITDGYLVSIQLVRSATSALAYATLQDIVDVPVRVERFGEEVVRYQSESALSGELVTHYVRTIPSVQNVLVDISVSTFGAQTALYEQAVNAMLQSLELASSSDEDETGPLADRVNITAPTPRETVASPITLTGEAPGNWFFEASAPVVVVNWDGLIIGESFITAEGEWMTEELVPFSGTIEYDLPADTYSTTGTVIFQRDNPSGLPENDAAVEVPVELVPTTEAVE